jgi:hypothetical protein
MDGSRFDDIARSLASPATRRRFFAGLVGSALGLAGFRGVDAAECRAAGRVCSAHATCCSGRCGAKDRTGRRTCACPTGTAFCGGRCVDPATAFQTDPANCGACGNRCPRAECLVTTCSGGICGLAADPEPEGEPCDDGNPCTIDSCDPQTGRCLNTPKSCNDNNACTRDTCDVATGNCVHTPISCSDGNPCTIDTCDPQVGCIHRPKDCDDNNACTTDTCDPTTGNCVHTPISCSDGNPCTIGKCDPVAGCLYRPKDCDDNNACTTDTCDPTTGNCVHTPIDEFTQGLCNGV